jgi:hypothetical protein
VEVARFELLRSMCIKIPGLTKLFAHEMETRDNKRQLNQKRRRFPLEIHITVQRRENMLGASPDIYAISFVDKEKLFPFFFVPFFHFSVHTDGFKGNRFTCSRHLAHFHKR